MSPGMSPAWPGSDVGAEEARVRSRDESSGILIAPAVDGERAARNTPKQLPRQITRRASSSLNIPDPGGSVALLSVDSGTASKSLLERKHLAAQEQGMTSRQGSMSTNNLEYVLEPYEAWKIELRKDYHLSEKRRQSMTNMALVAAKTSQLKENSVTVESRGSALKTDVKTRSAIPPGGQFKTVWNMLIASCVLHDLIVIPLYVFEFKEVLFLTVLEWMTQLFWTADLITSSMTGFYEKGSLILDLKRSFFHYMKTWGPFDLALVTVGWLFIFMEFGDDDQASGDLLAWSRTLRALRFLRFVRVLHWLKLRGVAEAFQEMFHSNVAFFYYSLIMAGMRLLILNHLLACCWYGIALLEHPNPNWVENAGLWNAPDLDKYLTSLNWSWAMLGVGLSNNLAANSIEVAFSVLVAFRSLMTYATLISSITTLSGALNKIKEDENSEFRLLRSYLAHNDIDQELSQKITRFLQHQYHLRQQARSAHLRVPLLDLLSNSLKGELDFARRNDAMLKLSYLDNLLPTEDVQVMQTMHNLATGAMEDVAAASGDFIFLGGSKATAAYLKLNGSLNYFYADRNEEEKHQEVTDETWIAEICLWASWAYQGDLVAEDVSRLTVINVDAFCAILSQCYTTHTKAIEYSRDFIKNFKRKEELTDLQPSFDMFSDFSEETVEKSSATCCFRCCPAKGDSSTPVRPVSVLAGTS